MRYNSTLAISQPLRTFYEKDVKLDQEAEKNSRKIVKAIVSRLVEAMKKDSNDFAELFADIYHEDSNYVKPKVSEHSQNVELNLVLEMNGAKVEICGLGTRDRNPQLGFVKVIWPSLASMKISFNASDGMIYLSPEKIYSLLQNACDSALRALSNRIILSGKEYMVYRHYSEKKTFHNNCDRN